MSQKCVCVCVCVWGGGGGGGMIAVKFVVAFLSFRLQHSVKDSAAMLKTINVNRGKSNS